MKKQWILILAGVLAAVVLLAFFPLIRVLIPVAGRGLVEVISLPRDSWRARSPASLIPARAGLMVRVRAASSVWDRLAASRTFQELSASPLWREERIGERLAEARRSFEIRTGFRLDRANVMEVAGDDIALAVIPPAEVEPAALLAVTRLGLKARLTEIVLRLADSLKDGPERFLREERYRGETVLVIPPGEDFPFETAYAVIDGYLAAAVSDSARTLIEEVIDLARGEGTALAGSEEFARVLDGEGFDAYPCLECYLAPNRFGRGLERGLPAGPVAETAAWAEVFLRSLGPCRAIGWKTGYRETVPTGIHARLQIALEGEDPAAADRIPVPPGRLPAGKMLYGWFAADPSAAGERLAGRLGPSGGGGETGAFPGLEAWEREAGLSLRRDILPVLGSEWSVVLGGLTGGEFIPLPPFALVNRAADPPGAERALAKVVAWAVLSRGLRPVRESYGEAEITSLPGLFFIEPAYALEGGELMIAGTPAMLKGLIDLRDDGVAAVGDDPDYRAATAPLPAGGEVLLFLRGENFLASLKAAAEWYFAHQRLAPDEPLVPEDTYREKVLPLLGLLRPLRSAAVTLDRENNIVRTDCFVYIPRQD